MVWATFGGLVIALSILWLGACAEPQAAPAWALDRLWLEPAAEGVHGFQVWTLFSEAWERSLDEGDAVCSAVVELEGESLSNADLCEGCVLGWAITGEILETDCAGAADPRWTRLDQVAFGELPGALTWLSPHANAVGGYATYESAWVPHGWAYAARQDYSGETLDAWDGEHPFTFVPAWAWDLRVP